MDSFPFWSLYWWFGTIHSIRNLEDGFKWKDTKPIVIHCQPDRCINSDPYMQQGLQLPYENWSKVDKLKPKILETRNKSTNLISLISKIKW